MDSGSWTAVHVQLSVVRSADVSAAEDHQEPGPHPQRSSAVLKLLWQAIRDIEDNGLKNAPKRAGLPKSRHKAAGKLVEGPSSGGLERQLRRARPSVPVRPVSNRVLKVMIARGHHPHNAHETLRTAAACLEPHVWVIRLLQS